MSLPLLGVPLSPQITHDIIFFFADGSLPDVSPCKEDRNYERTQHGRQMSQLWKRDDHGSLAFLIEYKNTYDESYHRELNALMLLKGKYND
jgi:hypothetical protein